ncbi:hypothetical protein LLE49_16575 [Alicyclobacillus tolerans]|uniref:hypothetical protein n=1 Tax=Alicyclobacillus tolerans TaxID=90970 RepID=UPI001F26ED70|nr:hypothetical protein [Alicyclobacillus tolerans]MCF8566338.1 hypothetical protein [Alicyclobacillus tolerans]
MNDVELQILQSLLSLLTLVVGTALSILLPKLKKSVDAHLTEKQAAIANHVLDGLGSIAEAVVQDFNQRVVTQAKTNGNFTQELAQQVKQDAIAAVKDQGSSLLQLGQSTIGNVENLIASLVEQAVVKHHVDRPSA